MPLSRQDAIEITRHVETLLRQYDPLTFETAAHAMRPEDDPRRNLVSLLDLLIRIYSEKSSGVAAQALDRLNHFVRRSDGEPITAMTVEFTPAERALYGVEEVDLASVPDRTGLINELKGILRDISEELERPER